ncbi:MAG: NucA/NucB deoxyribonuclease domain-containing protein [Limisphaerales bacterium]
MTTNSFDVLSRLVQTDHLDVNGVTVLSTEGYSYEPGGQVQSYTNALGGVTTTFYTATGKPETRFNADGSTNVWQYYLDGRINLEIQRNGAYWQTTYDDVNRITTRTFYSAAGVAEATNSTQLDRRGNVIQRVDEGNNVFTNTFDGLDRPKITAGPAIITVNSVPSSGMNPGGPVTYVTNVLQQAVTNFYDAAGLAVTNLNALGEQHITCFDALRRPVDEEIHDANNNIVRQATAAWSADHQSVTVTQGTGATAITKTVYTDIAGNPVLTIAYPSTGVQEFIARTYDLSENLIAETHNSASNSVVTQWTSLSNSFDGLNRRVATTDRDGALTTYAFDSLGDLTNRTIPGGLQWEALYNNAGQVLQDWLIGGGGITTRVNTYTYYASGNPFAGLLDTKTDGNGYVGAYSYDDQLRPASVTHAVRNPGNVDTFWSYDPRGFVTNILEQNTLALTGPDPKVVSRTYDPYGQLSSETVTWNGATFSTGSQTWDASGRRTGLTLNGANYSFASRADGVLTYAGNPTGNGNYAYDTAGLLTSRAVGPRTTTIAARDGEGRPSSITTAINGVTQLTESIALNGDGTLASHTLYRPDFTDSRLYSYAGLSRRLTQEQLNLSGNATWTNSFTYDSGVAAGPGILTQMGEANAGAADWDGGVSPFSRVNTETNTCTGYSAYGEVNGDSTLEAWLDGQPLSVTTNSSYDPLYRIRWAAQMQLTPGAHQLKVAAQHPSGFYTAWATNSFTNNIAQETDAIYRDYDGNIEQRIWTDTNGAQLHLQDLYFDAKDRLTDVTDVDGNYNGFYWHAEYDGLDRRLLTEYYVMTNGDAQIGGVTPLTISQYYDPQVEFLELGVSYDNQTTWKLYGPDLNGRYGGMNGTGGLDAVSPYLNEFNPVISDVRGNILAEVTNGVAVWTAARPTGYGSVPGYQPVALGHGADVAQSSAWRGRWMDITSYYNIGKRPYGPLDGMWLSYDPVWNAKDPNYLTFAGGDPIMGFDADGRCPAPSATPQAGDYYMSTPFGNIAFDESGGTEIWIGDMFCYLPAHSGFNPLEGVGDMAEQYALDTILNYSAIQQDASLAFNQNYSSGWGMAIGVTAGVKLGADVLMVAGNALSFGELGVGRTAVQKGLTGITETGVNGLTQVAVKTLPELQIVASKYPELAENILNAQLAGHPQVLTVGGDIAANRAAALEGIPNIPGLSRDEYPFASSMEGGEGAWVGHIPVAQQNAQGGLISRFLIQNNLSAGSQYMVLIVP